MNKMLTGKAFVFGKNIDTDQIYPGRFVELTDVEDVAKHAMEGADPNFVHVFKPGDLIVAGTNFGCGSSREHAAITLKAVGVGAIIAESFGRIFYRNGINLGMPLIICSGIERLVQQGDILALNVETGAIQNAKDETIAQAQPISEYMMNILTSGGIKPLIKKQFEENIK